jgi:nitrogen fixation protein NifU and related proteins
MNDLYREEILEHYNSPQNFGKLETFNTSSKQLNPFCGDEIEIFIQFARDQRQETSDKIQDIRFSGKGCAISIAAASMLTEYAKGKTKEELTKFSEDDMLSLLGIAVSPTRKKCALLARAVLRDCISV